MVRPIQTVDQVLRLEIGYNNPMAPASLMDAIIEALERGGILDAAGIIYLRGETPAENLVAINLWAPDVELTIEVPPTPGAREVMEMEARESARRRLTEENTPDTTPTLEDVFKPEELEAMEPNL